MKLMTLNTHSLVESSYEEKKEKFIETLIAEQPDVVALQEVNQTASAGIIPDVMLAGYKRCMDFGLPEEKTITRKKLLKHSEKKMYIIIGPGCLQRSDMGNMMKEWLFCQRNRL